MRLSSARVRRLSLDRGESLSAVLRRAGVSRTAFYSLARRGTVLPKTVLALAKTLGVSPSAILESPAPESASDPTMRLREAQSIVQRTGASFENVWHTLCLLDLDPLERLNRSLIRGRATAIHR